MRQIGVGILAVLCMVCITATGYSQKKTMTWTTKSKAAHELAVSGVKHFMNVESEQAYADFSDALKLDPDFTVVLAFMTNMTRGEMRKKYEERTLKSATNKTEGEKLFASIQDSTKTPQERRDIWAKLYTMFPDGAMLGHFNVQSRATPEERFTAAQEYIAKFPEEAAMHNTIAYYYLLNKKDNAMAKQHLEKYMSLYPEGANPYDSMGELYLNTGDTANAKKYYSLALEKYPFMNSSVNAMQKILDSEKQKETK
jgi:tetratricopeptide (TPR) repeat protein